MNKGKKMRRGSTNQESQGKEVKDVILNCLNFHLNTKVNTTCKRKLISVCHFNVACTSLSQRLPKAISKILVQDNTISNF